NLNRDLPKEPVYFSKPPTVVVGPEDAVFFDEAVSPKMDWEAELAVIIARGGKNIAKDRALAHAFGYCTFNDARARYISPARAAAGGTWARAWTPTGSLARGS